MRWKNSLAMKSYRFMSWKTKEIIGMDWEMWESDGKWFIDKKKCNTYFINLLGVPVLQQMICWDTCEK